MIQFRGITKRYDNNHYALKNINLDIMAGEFVFIVSPPEEPQYSVADVRELLAKRLQETSLKTAVKELSEQLGLNKNEVYALALELKNE